MPDNFTVIEGAYHKLYHYNVPPVVGYGRAFDGYTIDSLPAAPQIHTYNPDPKTILPLLALKKQPAIIHIDSAKYTVEHFLVVQCLDDAFIKDDGDIFRPTIKPHYAIAPINGSGNIYNKNCMAMIQQDNTIVRSPFNLPVHAHDNLLSPAHSIADLKNLLIISHSQNKSLFLTSYVVDEVHKKVLITQHCLLNTREHESLETILENLPEKNIEALIDATSPIQSKLTQFYVSPDDATIASSIQPLFAHQTKHTPSRTHTTPSTASKSTRPNRTRHKTAPNRQPAAEAEEAEEKRDNSSHAAQEQVPPDTTKTTTQNQSENSVATGEAHDQLLLSSPLNNKTLTPLQSTIDKAQYFPTPKQKNKLNQSTDIDWYFYFKCLSGVTMLTGAAMLITYLLLPAAIIGLAMSGAYTLSVGSLGYFASSTSSSSQSKKPAQSEAAAFNH
ncbi:MAG: hypothetical protein P1U61_02545 [Legionellaceae bacterium]|nr:hypothetical protein [Legionellaceae bacterium]